MARIVIITSAYDDFSNRHYLLGTLFRYWSAAGHTMAFATNLGEWPEGDVAIMHVDLSVVPEAYVEASKQYPVVVNGAARDVRKNVVSRHLVRPDDGWTGPVIVKTDLNCGGLPEVLHSRQAQLQGRPAEFPRVGEIVCTDRPYPILRSARAVPADVWNNPGLVVERFLPEQDARGFWLRTWVFFGDRERSSRFLGSHPIVKASNVVAREPGSVPDELRAERKRLGFDFGKFDFVIHAGKPILLDANATPRAPPPSVSQSMEASNANLAQGLEAMLRTT